MTSRRPRSSGLAAELQSNHRLTFGVLLAVLLLSLATSGYLILVSQPRVESYVELTRHARDVHDGMLDEETGLRAWLATGDSQFLPAYESGRSSSDRAVKALLADVDQSRDVTSDVLRTLLTRQKWQAWATRAASTTFTPAQRTDGTLTDFLLQGKSLFDTYRAADDHSTGLIKKGRSSAVSFQHVALEVVLGSYLLLLAVAAGITLRRRHRLCTTINAPLLDLHDTIIALRSGELAARAKPTTVPELSEIGEALGGLAGDLSRARVDATARERRLAKIAYRFETVVRVGREIAGSLSVHYVSATVTSAAAELLNTSAVLWLRGESSSFEAIHRSRDPHGVVPPGDLVPPAIVARAAADAQTLTELGRSAYPLVLAGRVTAVLEVATTDVDADTDQVLTALLSTAAASLESAHLHSTAREMADQDGLTHLPNRRRFEADVESEWERCRRYSRPMSMVMMDLDHFKRLNDQHGHLLGDEVLREVARVVTGALRTTDTAYRYGGEEIVVLLRETRLDDAASAAERLRLAVAGVTLAGHPTVTVSASAGVSTRRSSMTHYTDLVAEADQALYEAKHQGRDRVECARVGSQDDGETLVHGDSDGSLLPRQITPG